MSNTALLFHRISYLQYPCMLLALFLVSYSIITDIQTIFYYFNHALVFMGLGVSFSTLQDTTTTQNEISRKVWVDPVKGKRMITVSGITTFTFILLGITGLLSSPDSIIRQLSLGFIAFGIGLIGMLKAMIEMFENHRIDKNPNQETE